MASKREEQEFTDDIDRMLSGSKAGAENDADADYASDLAFAGKILETRVMPSRTFQASLKQKLIAQLAEAEETGRTRSSIGAWFRQQFAQRPAWQTATIATVMVAVVALLVVWRAGLLSPHKAPIVTITSPTIAVEAAATIDKDAYVPGAPVEINFTIRNLSSEPLTFAFPPAFRIETPSAETTRSFPTGNVAESLSPAESVSYSTTWDRRGDQTLPPGLPGAFRG